MILRLSVPAQTGEHRRLLSEGRISVVPEPTYGTQLQDLAIQEHRSEGGMHISYQERQISLADGTTISLREPSYRITNLGYGPLHPNVMISPRVAPQMIGLGLLEAIPEAAILANADPDDRDGDGISGKSSRVWSRVYQKVVLGRFGWQAGMPNILEQSSSAFAGDIGISSDLLPAPFGDCTPAQTAAKEGLTEKAAEPPKSNAR